MTILFADDHFLILEGLKELVLHSWPDAEIILATNKVELFKKLNHHKIDIIIQDIKFGEDNASDFLQEIYAYNPKIKILVLSSISDTSTINRFMKRTNGYILKTEPADIIIEGIDVVLQGGQFLSPKAKHYATALFSNQSTIPLTKRELDVVKEIMREFSTKDIAKNLQVSEKTVEMHRANIYLKLDVTNVTGLVKKVIGLDLIDN